MELQTVVMLTIGSLIIGLAAGALLAKLLAPQQQDKKKLEEHIQKLQRQQQSYQEQVNEHFNKTAELLNHMAESYRDVHNHLARSAVELTSHGISPLQALPEDRPVIQGKPQPVSTQPPLDYAPKSPGNKGALDEEYGLEKIKKEAPATTPTGL